MARIDIKSTGTTLDTGILQLENGVAMDATLRKVTDQNNTASPLLLSTTGVQTTSKIQITTAATSYIDAEDNSGNNRFTVGRDPSSQLVTVDFASLPTALTTPVGAIRTATDGVNLANVMTFLENGNIGLDTDTPGSKFDVHSAANTIAQFNRTGTGNSQIQHLMTGTARWTTGFVSATGNYSIFDNVNSLFRTNLSNTGLLTIGNGDTALTAVFNVKGTGSTTSTRSIRVDNSTSNNIFNVYDTGLVEARTGNIFQSIVINPAVPQISGGQGGLITFSSTINRTTITDQAVFITASVSLDNIRVGGIGINCTLVSNSFSIDSTTQGFLPPRMTTAQKNAIVTPAAGLMVYDTNLNKLCVRTAAAWETITSI
jgi:hypothetical protein